MGPKRRTCEQILFTDRYKKKWMGGGVLTILQRWDIWSLRSHLYLEIQLPEESYSQQRALTLLRGSAYNISKYLLDEFLLQLYSAQRLRKEK